jgi:hypothetical protein
MQLVRFRRSLGAVGALLLATVLPAYGQDATLAPADESFGRFNLSVLAIANTIRDAGARLDAGGDARAIVSGPLSFATDAIHAWETRYPNDPWIAKDLLALETVQLKLTTDDGTRLATATEAWLLADFPNSPEAARARNLLAGATPAIQPQSVPSNAWERFAALRVPLPPR